DGQRRLLVDEVDERIRPGRDDADIVALVRLLHLTEDPRKAVLDVVEESLEVPWRAAHTEGLDAAGEAVAPGRTLGTDGAGPGGCEEVLEDHALEAPPAGSASRRSTARASSTTVITVLLSATQSSTMMAESAASRPLPLGRFMIANVNRFCRAPPVNTQP